MPSRLYERSGETALIDAALARLDEGRGACLLLEGRAGRGKSTLVEYAVARAREREARTLVARARHLTSAAPFEVLRRLLGPAVEEAGGVDALEGAARFAIPLFTPGSDLSHGVDYGCQWLIAWLAERAPLVLAIDDAHWADPASLRVLLDVQAELAFQRVVLLVASRPVENPEVQRLVATMAGQPECEVLIPGPLSREAVAQVVADRLGGADETFVDACLKVSRGNAFYLSEVLRPFEDDPELDRSTFAADDAPSLRRTVSWRLGELGPDATALAQAAAVLGDGSSLRHVAELARQEESDAVGHAARLEVASILVHGDPVEFLHPLLRAAVEAELPDVVLGELHGRAARLLWESGEDAGSVAQHLLASPGSGDVAVSEYLAEQGRAVLESGSAALAQRLLNRALQEPAPAEQRDRLLLWLGRADHVALDLDAAREHLEEALASDDRDVALSAAGVLFDVLDDANLYADVGRVARRALRLRPFGATEPERILQASLFAIVTMGMDAELGELPGELADTDASTLPTDRDVDRHLVVWAAVHQRSRAGGTTERLMAALRAVVDALPISPDDWTEWDVRSALSAATFLAEADYDEAEQVLDRAAPAAARMSGSRPQLQAELDHRWIGQAISRGSFEDALARIEAAADFTSRHGVAGFDGLHRFSRSRIAVEQGDFSLAGELLAERLTEDLVYPALGALLSGDAPSGAAMLDELELSTEPDAPLRQIEVELQAHLLASHVHEVLGDRDRAEAEAMRELQIRRRFGPVSQLAESLRRVASFAPARQAVAILDEAATLATSSPNRPVQARVLTSYGLALQRAGQHETAREVLYRATDLAGDMGMDHVVRRAQEGLQAAGGRPRRIRATGPTALTGSQMEVALLATDGLTNRQIAERLFVTIKTVETHLMAVYRKLGIRRRDELAGALQVAAG
jgi:DNA-binding CsgD family transcriptional regulator